MGTGYTILDPSRRKYPSPFDKSADDDSQNVETDVGDGSPSSASSHAKRAESRMVVHEVNKEKEPARACAARKFDRGHSVKSAS